MFVDVNINLDTIMAFRKRNIALGGGPSGDRPSDSATAPAIPGLRPSSLTSHPVTSTGASSLDSLLGGHGGLALGTSLLVEESGTTDFAGATLRYYAAEGVCQGHAVHVVGMGDPWVRELPGVAEDRSSSLREQSKPDEGRMKIAWRYERLGQADERGKLTVQLNAEFKCCLNFHGTILSFFVLHSNGKYSSSRATIFHLVTIS